MQVIETNLALPGHRACGTQSLGLFLVWISWMLVRMFTYPSVMQQSATSRQHLKGGLKQFPYLVLLGLSKYPELKLIEAWGDQDICGVANHGRIHQGAMKYVGINMKF